MSRSVSTSQRLSVKKREALKRRAKDRREKKGMRAAMLWLLLVWASSSALGAVPPLSPEAAFEEAEVVMIGVLGPPTVEEVRRECRLVFSL